MIHSETTQLPTPEDTLKDFRAQIEELTLHAVCGQRYVRVAKLREWLSSVYHDTNESKLERLLYACIPPTKLQRLRPFITPEQLKPKKSIVLLGTLCMIDRFHYLEQLWQRPFFCEQLPADGSNLKKELQAAKISDAESIARAFFETQWMFCPVVFRLDDDTQHRTNHILPIVRKNLINDKSETAELVQIEVLEEFVDEKLQKRVPQSRYDHVEDGLGARYQFALKTFYGEQSGPQYYREKINFANLRNYKGMISCLNMFLHRKRDVPRRYSTQSEDSRNESSTFTYNFLLEYGDRDLDTYFVQMVPPFLEPEIVEFWKELFEIVKAVAAIHSYVNPDTGRQDYRYKGFHADIKPENILLVEGKCKLADFGFTVFIEETGTAPRTYLPGTTWKYSPPEHLPGRKGKVTQSVDIWSLGCVFSIAATWITGGYSSVRDFTRVREKAIEKVILNQPNNLGSLTGGDLFCDGAHLLEDVKAWHQALRMSVRHSDKVTAQVLDIVDQDMLVDNPSHRIGCEELCRKLQKIIENSPVDPQKQLPLSILKALQDINDEALHVHPPASLSTSKQMTTEATGTAQERKDNNAQISNTSSRKTACGEEYPRSAWSIPVPFQDSYAAFEDYPKRRIHLAFSDAIITEHQRLLRDAEANNFQLLQRPENGPLKQSLTGISQPDQSKTEVIFLEQSSLPPVMVEKLATCDEEVRSCLGDTTKVGAQGITGSIACRDPLCRFIFLRGESSLSPLLLTKRSLQRLLTYHQIMPGFLSFLKLFGRRVKTVDHVGCDFREESHINSPPPDLRMDALGRSGRHFQLCYSLKSPL